MALAVVALAAAAALAVLPVAASQPTGLLILEPRVDTAVATGTIVMSLAAAIALLGSASRNLAPRLVGLALVLIAAGDIVGTAFAATPVGEWAGDHRDAVAVAALLQAAAWLGAAVLMLLAVERSNRLQAVRSSLARILRWPRDRTSAALAGAGVVITAALWGALSGGLAGAAALDDGAGLGAPMHALAAILLATATARLVRRCGLSRPTRPLVVALAVAGVAEAYATLLPGVEASVLAPGEVLQAFVPAILLVDALRGNARPALAPAPPRVVAAEAALLAREERARLARDVHDGLAQELWYAKVRQEQLCSLVTDPNARDACLDVARAIDRALADAQEAVLELRSAAEAVGPFHAAAARYTREFGERFDLEARFDVEGVPVGVPPPIQAELLRILQEALSNVRKHAAATSVVIRSTFSPSGLRLTIADDGIGFDPRRTRPGGFGLQSMLQRATGIGATLSIDSAPLRGTRVLVHLPMRRGEDAGR